MTTQSSNRHVIRDLMVLLMKVLIQKTVVKQSVRKVEKEILAYQQDQKVSHNFSVSWQSVRLSPQIPWHLPVIHIA